MPERETAAAFIAAVEGGDHVGAIERERFFYDPACFKA